VGAARDDPHPDRQILSFDECDDSFFALLISSCSPLGGSMQERRPPRAFDTPHTYSHPWAPCQRHEFSTTKCGSIRNEIRPERVALYGLLLPPSSSPPPRYRLLFLSFAVPLLCSSTPAAPVHCNSPPTTSVWHTTALLVTCYNHRSVMPPSLPLLHHASNSEPHLQSMTSTGR
jgi:hypothetical protein